MQYQNFSAMMGKMKGMKLGKGGNLSARNVNQIAQMMPQNVMSQMGGKKGEGKGRGGRGKGEEGSS